MAVYQVAIIFNASDDEDATYIAGQIQKTVYYEQEHHYRSLNSKISFVKFEQEAPEVASE